ncbi:MAG: hypothetical protein JWL97_4248, partial [Gemmatimonadales bacterium]|jgi:hypothetical protein|nr:hypothetical protein [Gemmatimonadales bacterium]
MASGVLNTFREAGSAFGVAFPSQQLCKFGIERLNIFLSNHPAPAPERVKAFIRLVA